MLNLEERGVSQVETLLFFFLYLYFSLVRGTISRKRGGTYGQTVTKRKD